MPLRNSYGGLFIHSSSSCAVDWKMPVFFIRSYSLSARERGLIELQIDPTFELIDENGIIGSSAMIAYLRHSWRRSFCRRFFFPWRQTSSSQRSSYKRSEIQRPSPYEPWSQWSAASGQAWQALSQLYPFWLTTRPNRMFGWLKRGSVSGTVFSLLKVGE